MSLEQVWCLPQTLHAQSCRKSRTRNNFGGLASSSNNLAILGLLRDMNTTLLRTHAATQTFTDAVKNIHLEERRALSTNAISLPLTIADKTPLRTGRHSRHSPAASSSDTDLLKQLSAVAEIKVWILRHWRSDSRRRYDETVRISCLSRVTSRTEWH